MIEIPGYTIVRTLGKGGMAEVHLAIQQSFEREVALKILARDLSGDASFSERFIREAKIVSRLVHPNIVTVYDVGIENNHHFLSMEYIPGEDLKQARHHLPLSRRLEIVKDVARALNFAGKKGYVHRDVKPENIMLHTEDRRAVLMDFGIARPSGVQTGMTQTGTAIGTPHYMSPEQARGQNVDPRSDLYSLGVVLFLLLAGHVPFDADSAVAVGVKHVAEPIPLLPDHLQIFQPIINKAMSKAPEHRYQSGDEFVAALDALSVEAVAVLESAEQVEAAQNSRVALDADRDAPTLVDQPTVVAQDDSADASTGSDLAETQEVEEVQDESSADDSSELTDVEVRTSAEDRLNPESGGHRAALWPWVAGLVIAGGVAFGVYYQQQIPAEYRLQLMDELLGRSSLSVEGREDNEPLSSEDIRVQSRKKLELQTHEMLEPQFVEGDKPQLVTGGMNALETVLSDKLQVPSHSLTETQVVAGARVDTLEDEQAQVQALMMRLPEELSLVPQAANLYRGILGRDPINAEARQGLQQLRDWLGEQARTAFDNRDFDAVHTHLALAKKIFPRITQDSDFRRIEARMGNLQQMDEWLQQAENHLQNNALTLPEEANALASFRQVLTIDPDNQQARRGVASIINRYGGMAERRASQGQWHKAEIALQKGLAIDPQSQRLQKLQVSVQRAQKVGVLLARAKELRQRGQLLTPSGSNSLEVLRKAQALDKKNVQIRQSITTIERGLVEQVQQRIDQGQLDDARADLARALVYFPKSRQLRALKATNEEAIRAEIAASQPNIPKLLVSNIELSAITDPQLSLLSVDRIIHVGFQFANFTSVTSVVQAILFDGSRRLQIVQVPVIVTGAAGVQFFRIERPVEGFGDGGYSIDLMLDGQRLISAAFEVKHRAGF